MTQEGEQVTTEAPEAPAYVYRAVVRSIYDGDTMRVDVDLGFGTWRMDQILRLAGIDTPEVRGIERDDGLRARAFVEDRIPPGSVVLIRTYRDRTGKYGRYIAEVWRDGISLGDELLRAGLAVPYGADWPAGE